MFRRANLLIINRVKIIDEIKVIVIVEEIQVPHITQKAQSSLQSDLF